MKARSDPMVPITALIEALKLDPVNIAMTLDLWKIENKAEDGDILIRKSQKAAVSRKITVLAFDQKQAGQGQMI